MATEPIRVTVFHNLPAPYRLQWFEHMMADSDLDVHIFLTGKSKSNRPHWSRASEADNQRVTTLGGFGVPLKGLHNDRFNVNPGFLRFLDMKPDVVLLFGYIDPTNIAVASVCSLKGIPYVLFAEVSDVWYKSITSRMSASIVRRMVRRASALAPASKSCARFFESLGGKTDTMLVIPCVPDLAPIRETRESNLARLQEIRQRLGLSGRRIVLFVGRLTDFKGVREAVDALALVKLAVPDISMVFVGRGPLESYVREKSKELSPNLVFFGSANDDLLHDLYSIADVHILPSWHEAFGVVCAEALGFGVPSIVTRTSGCSDLIVDGENGYLIEPQDPKQLARAIGHVLSCDDSLERMKKNAFAMSDDFEMNRIMRQLKKLILLASGQSASP